jgi:hydroxymethylpyrimidine pyrophosphatase-like HAD family hydrolase
MPEFEIGKVYLADENFWEQFLSEDILRQIIATMTKTPLVDVAKRDEENWFVFEDFKKSAIEFFTKLYPDRLMQYLGPDRLGDINDKTLLIFKNFDFSKLSVN